MYVLLYALLDLNDIDKYQFFKNKHCFVACPTQPGNWGNTNNYVYWLFSNFASYNYKKYTQRIAVLVRKTTIKDFC